MYVYIYIKKANFIHSIFPSVWGNIHTLKGMGFPSSSNPACSHIGTQTPCDRKTPRHWQPTCQGVIGEPFFFCNMACFMPKKKQVSSGFAIELTTVLQHLNDTMYCTYDQIILNAVKNHRLHKCTSYVLGSQIGRRSFPFRARPIFKLLVSGRIACIENNP